MTRTTINRAFSLVEVVIAVGILAIAVTGVLGVLPPLARQNLEATDQAAALRLPSVLESELHRLAATDGFNVVAARIPIMSTPLENGMTFVATHDGSAFASVETPGAIIPDDARYFEVEIWRFHDAPLAYDATGAVLIVYVRVSWPCRLPGSPLPTDLQTRMQTSWTLAINR